MHLKKKKLDYILREIHEMKSFKIKKKKLFNFKLIIEKK